MTMTLDDIPAGEPVLVDTNVFVYAFTKKSARCLSLVQRCRAREVDGTVSTHTLSEVCHRTMLAEAAELLKRQQISAKFLKGKPELFGSLRRYSSFVENLVRWSNLAIVQPSAEHFLRSQWIRDRYGLLTTDSINLCLMLEYNITAIATNDSDFERIEGIQVYKPGDIA